MLFQFTCCNNQQTLSEIKPVTELWKIKSMVIRVWGAILLGNGKQISLHMILIDHHV
jgi:hypothetical protein